MKKIFVISILFSAVVLSCGKNKLDSNGKVHVRIENLAGFTIKNVNVADANFGDLIQGQVTNYKILDQPIYAGYCSFTKDNVQSGAGVLVCGTPPPPPFKPGYYTFIVTPEVNEYNNVTVIEN